MRRIMRIGILGAAINNANMGCVALTYSMVNLLERIAKNNNLQFNYRLFDYQTDKTRLIAMAEKLDVAEERLELLHVRGGSFYSFREFLRLVKHIKANIYVKRYLTECDLVVDLTQGDSFSDIYGKERFYEGTITKQLVIDYGVPLILGPQTYGPFENSQVREKAKQVIEKACLVISRDAASKEYVDSFCNKDVVVGTDLAFALPYDKPQKVNTGKIKIGINVSGLLCARKSDGSKLQPNFKTDYDEYIGRVIQTLKDAGNYEIHLISHVGNEANIGMPGIDGVVYHGEYASPCEVKSLIAEMDVFIGARMHATIGAFSSGVATIPVAYSRKFTGLFNAIGYNKIIDIRELDTDAAVERTLEYVYDYKQLAEENVRCMKIAMGKYKVMEEALASTILSISNKK